MDAERFQPLPINADLGLCLLREPLDAAPERRGIEAKLRDR